MAREKGECNIPGCAKRIYLRKYCREHHAAIVQLGVPEDYIADLQRLGDARLPEIDIDPMMSPDFRRVQGQYNELVHRNKVLRQALIDQDQRNALMGELIDPVDYKLSISEECRSPNEVTAVAHFSDAHIGDQIYQAKVRGLNSYHWEVTEKRVGRYFDNLARIFKNDQEAYALNNLVLFLGGDNMNGDIHDLAETNEIATPEAGYRFKCLVTAGIRYLLQATTAKISVLCTHGNHTRTGEKPSTKRGAEHNHEWICFEYIRDEFVKEDRVDFVITDGQYIDFDIYKYHTLWWHGENVAYRGGIGGFWIPLNKLLLRMRKSRRFDIWNIGHLHTYSPARDGVVNGSICGYSEFAVRYGFEFEPPQQAYYLLHKSRGICDHKQIWLQYDDEMELWR